MAYLDLRQVAAEVCWPRCLLLTSLPTRAARAIWIGCTTSPCVSALFLSLSVLYICPSDGNLSTERLLWRVASDGVHASGSRLSLVQRCHLPNHLPAVGPREAMHVGLG